MILLHLVRDEKTVPFLLVYRRQMKLHGKLFHLGPKNSAIWKSTQSTLNENFSNVIVIQPTLSRAPDSIHCGNAVSSDPSMSTFIKKVATTALSESWMSYLMKIKNQPWGKRLFSCHGHWQPLEYSMSPCVSWHPWNLKFLSKFARVIKRAKTLRKKLGFVPTYREGVGVKPVGTKSQLLPNKKNEGSPFSSTCINALLVKTINGVWKVQKVDKSRHLFRGARLKNLSEIFGQR